MTLTKSWVWSLIGALLLAACAGGAQTGPALSIIYERSAQYHKPDRNPIIVIPGILGSRLVDQDSGRIVWGAFDGKSAKPGRRSDAQLLALPISDDTPFHELTDRVRPDGVLDQVRVSLLGLPIDVRAYVGILSTLGVGGYRDEALGLNAIDYGDAHFTCFQFDYDWRRDNVENAQRLKAFIDDRRAYIQAEYKKRFGIEHTEIKFDIVAHSMGGLLTRYFLRYGDADLPEDGSLPPVSWAGAEDVERAVLIGVPNAGAPEALEQLVNGYAKGRPILPRYPSAILGTYPSIYELLPRPRHQRIIYEDTSEPVSDIYDAALWETYEWGLAERSERLTQFLQDALPDEPDDEARRRVALGHQAAALARAKAFHAALDQPAVPPDGLDLYLLAGDAEQTAITAKVDRETGAVSFQDYGPGDGTVPRYSALMDERVGGEWAPTLVSPIAWTNVTFIFANHIGLTTDPAFADNVLYLLLEDPRG